MGYLGNDLKVAYSTYKNIDDISGSFNGSTTSFSLLVGGVAPSPLPLNSQQCLISVGGVVQRPDDTGAEGFRLSGGNIVFSSAPGTGEDFFGVILAGADYVNVGANFPSGSAAVPSITFDSDLDTGIYNSAANQVSITTAGTERLRIDSAGQIESVSLGSASAPAFSFTTDPNTGIYSPGADQVAISTNGSGRLFVSSGGQIGVGTSTVGSSGNANITIAGANNSGIQFGRTNATAGGGLLTSASGPGIAFHYYTGAVGSETYTEAMRLDSSGRLLVGTSTAQGDHFLQVQGQAGSATDWAGFALRRGQNAASIPTGGGQLLGRIIYSSADGGQGAYITALTDGDWSSTSDCPTRLVFSTTADGASSPGEAMRIDNAGRVGFSYGATNGVLTDWGYGGYRGIGANSNVTTLSSQRASWFLRGSLQNSNSELANCILLLQDTGGAAISPGDLIKGYSGTTFVFRVANNGGVQNQPNSYGAISDQRLKQDIEDAGSQWNDIKQIRVRKFKFRSEPEKSPYIGVVAQEVEAVSPGLIDQALLEDGTPDPECYKSVKYSVLYMKAIKALQEAMERIEQLEASNADLLARVTALEAA